MPSIRVLIVDDAPAWRQCVRLMLEEHSTFQVVGEASDGLEAIQKSQQLQPDVILLDVCLPILNGIEAAAHICKSSPHSKILFVSIMRSTGIMEQLFRHNSSVLGYIHKLDVAEWLIPAIHAAIQQRRFIGDISGEA